MLHKPEGDSCSPTACMQFNLQADIWFSCSNASKCGKELFHQQLFLIHYRVATRSGGGPTARRHHIHKTTLPFGKYLH